MGSPPYSTRTQFRAPLRPRPSRPGFSLVSIPCLRSSLISRVATSSPKQPSLMKYSFCSVVLRAELLKVAIVLVSESMSALLSFHLKEFFSFVFFLVLSSLHRRPRLVRNRNRHARVEEP